MELQHSPAPWSNRQTAVYELIESSEGDLVAFLGLRSPEVAKANRRLIKAAPEMYSALNLYFTDRAQFETAAKAALRRAAN